MSVSSPSIGSPTDPLFGNFGGLIEITGLHSVIPYHSRIFPSGQSFWKLSKRLSGHFSAPTTAYLMVCKGYVIPSPPGRGLGRGLDAAIIIFRNVGVAVSAVAFE